MMRRLLVVCLLLAVMVGQASAGIFSKKNKPSPNERVPELLNIVKTDGDEHKRSAAAEELRQYDPKQFPTIVPTLIDVLGNDPKPSVRSEAAQTLGKLRPVSKDVGMALEQSVAKDTSMRVRLQARSALLQYHWHGYHGGKETGPALTQSPEPPLAPPQASPPPAPQSPPRIEPKPVAPPAKATPANNSNGPQPLPQGPPLVPTEVPHLKPAPTSGDQGPALNGPE
jgi:hypothetical protein